MAYFGIYALECDKVCTASQFDWDMVWGFLDVVEKGKRLLGCN